MQDSKKSGHSSINQFLQKFSTLSNKLSNQLLDKSTSKQLEKVIQSIIYYQTKELLLQEFMEIVPPLKTISWKLSIQSKNRPIQKHLQVRKAKTSVETINNLQAIIQKELISHFEYSLSIDSKNEKESVISPVIFTHLFEQSICKGDKQKFGIYYTSKIEVEFMCKEALIHYLCENSPISIRKIIHFIYSKKFHERQINPDAGIKLSRKELLIIKKLLENSRILDLACGSGAFLLGMGKIIFHLLMMVYRELDLPFSEFQMKQKIIASCLFGLDTDRQAVQITILRLLFFLIDDYSDETDDADVKFKYNVVEQDSLVSYCNFSNSSPNNQEDQLFDIIIGNPPYIRQELITSKKEDSQKINTSKDDYKMKVIYNLQNKFSNKIDFHRNRKSDFYIYFFYRGLSLLKKGGILCYISSNSWLDVKYGFTFQKFLLEKYHIKTIYNNLSDKSFTAAINTIITTIHKSKSPLEIKNSLIRFIAFKKPYPEVINQGNILSIHSCSSNVSTPDFRCIPMTREQLLKEGTKKKQYIGCKWGARFFRAPDVFFRIINRAKEKIVLLSKLGEIRYPIKTGINDFFYLTKEDIEKFDIEPEFLYPVLKSPKKITRINISKQGRQTFLFLCKLTKKQLLSQNKKGALAYINWGEQQTTTSRQQTNKGTPWPEVPSVQHNKPEWYSLTKPDYADLFCTRFFDRRFFFSYCNEPIIEDQTFYGVILNPDYKKDKELVIALLNSTLSYLFLEIFGRTSLGKGALQFARYEMADHLILDPREIPTVIQGKIIDAFKSLISRPIKPIFDECHMTDRQVFDRIIFDWLGLTDEEGENLYQSLKQLVKDRLTKSGQY
ncbi:MAG: N-6 DNA methylase [Candidatus Heimdallarchaeota archaeon]|nr:N-6 DNA methylase [Candidatus Heimdallarchaeota archaeon]